MTEQIADPEIRTVEHKITSLNLRLAAILVIVIAISTAVRFYPILQYSPQPVTYEGGTVYYVNNTIQTGHLMNTTSANALVNPPGLPPNRFAGGIVEEAQYPFLPALFAPLLILTGVRLYSWEYQLLLSMTFAVPVMLICLSMSSFMGKRSHRDHPAGKGWRVLGFAAIVTLFSQLGSPALTTQLGASGWIFMLYSVFLLFYRSRPKVTTRVLGLSFMVSLPAVYFTDAGFFFLWIGAALIYGVLVRKDLRIVGPATLYFVVYLGYTVYLASFRTTSVVGILGGIVQTIQLGFLGFQTSAVALPSSYLVATSVANKIRYLVNSAAVAMIVGIFVIARRGVVDKRNEPGSILFAGVLALPIFLVLILIWLGSLSLLRMAEYGSLIALVILATTLPLSHGNTPKNPALPDERTPSRGTRAKPLARATFTNMILAVAIVALISSAVTYAMDENTPYRRATYQEDSAALWLMRGTPVTTVVFTDHRLAGVFVAHGYLSATGLTETTVSSTISQAQAVYYGNSGDAALRVINQTGARFLLFSSGMTQEAPAIYLYNYPIAPAPSNFLWKYNNTPALDSIFSNGEVTVYYVG